MSTKLAEEALREARVNNEEPEQTTIATPQDACVVAVQVYIPLLKAVFRNSSDNPGALLQKSLDQLNSLDNQIISSLPENNEIKRRLLLDAVVFAIEANREELLSPELLGPLFKTMSDVHVERQAPLFESKTSAILKLALLSSNWPSVEHTKPFIVNVAKASLEELAQTLASSSLSNEQEITCLQTIYSNFPDSVLNVMSDLKSISIEQAIYRVKLDYHNVLRAVMLECYT